MKKINILIPAAGKGIRTKLNYPKTLYKINDKPILINLIETFFKCNFLINKIIIISSKNGFNKITKTINSFGYQNICEILVQNQQLGMGDAVMQIKKSRFINEKSHIFLVWGDIFSPQVKTINKLVKKHFQYRNDFSLVSRKVKKPYTLVYRNNKNEIIDLIENKKNKITVHTGERDVGIFIFKLKPTLKFLNQISVKKNLHSSKEIGFLPIIKELVLNKFKVKCYCIAKKEDTFSFNSIEDVKKRLFN